MKIYYKNNKYGKICTYSFVEEKEMLCAEITESQYELLNEKFGAVSLESTEDGVNLVDKGYTKEELEELAAIRQKALPYEIRERRKAECFPYINRGELWYKNLSEEQKTELETWYQSWLNAPQTLTVPDKPEWLE